jgi:hypothetical protein
LATDRRGVAMLEFAILAPVMLLMATGGFDIARALIMWQETQYAAENIAQAAANMAATIVSNKPANTLTPAQAQAAMTAIYGAMPQLLIAGGSKTKNGQPVSGATNGLWVGHYGVTLSGVQWTTDPAPLPFLPWTVDLGDLAPTDVLTNYYDTSFKRDCGKNPGGWVQQSTVPSDTASNVLTSLPTQQMSSKGQYSTFILVDVYYQFNPILSFVTFVTGPINFYSTAFVPTYVGSNQLALIYNGGYPAAGNCTPFTNST